MRLVQAKNWELQRMKPIYCDFFFYTLMKWKCHKSQRIFNLMLLKVLVKHLETPLVGVSGHVTIQGEE